MDSNVKPLVSVILSAYNAQKYLSKALDSVMHQTYDSWELIVADDGSTDETASILKEYRKKDDRIRVVTLTKNKGLAVARNEAIQEARGKYLAIMDADDIALPERLATQVEFLERNPSIGAVGSNVELIDEAGRTIGKKMKPAEHDEIRFRMLLQTQLITPTVCMRADMCGALGGFDPNYTYAEDYDLWSRAVQAGYRLANINQTLLMYRNHESSISFAASTQPLQAERALKVNERNITPYLPLRREEILLLVKLVNGRELSVMETFNSLYWYRRLLKSFLANPQTNINEQYYARITYRDRKRHVLRTLIKRLLGIKTRH